MAAFEHPVRVRISRIRGETPRTLLRKDLHLPTVLGTIGWTEQAKHTTYDTVAAGQFSQPAPGPSSARQLRVLDDQDTLTMTWTPDWLHDQDRPPHEVRSVLVRILRSRKPVQLRMKQKGLGDDGEAIITLDVKLLSIRPQIKPGEADTVYYTLSWEEWRNPSAERKGAGKPAEIPSTVRIDRDDTLYSLAMHWYHTATMADDIAKENGIKKWGKKTPLVEHPRFKSGSKIKLPRRKRQTHFRTGGAQAPED